MIERGPDTLCRIEFDAQSMTFKLEDGGKSVSHEFAWTDVVRIRALNLDLGVYDEFCLTLEFDRGKTIQVVESDDGFFDFGQALAEKLQGFNLDWVDVFTRPAFSMIDRIVYQRGESEI